LHRRLTIENLSTDNGKPHSFDLVDKKDRDAHVAGAIAWGSGITSSLIFALSEPVDKNHHDGYHHAFDTEALTKAFTFDVQNAGDALCGDPTGEDRCRTSTFGSNPELGDIAALVTNNGVDSFLRIYDVKRKDGTAKREQRLEPFESQDHEVNSIAFSPDSLYLALGRCVLVNFPSLSYFTPALFSDDNRTHVYDSRMLSRGVLYDFEHATMRFSSKAHNFFGVVGVKWVESDSRRLGLVTGGNDGTFSS
jgi:hypothetical protein